MARQPKRSNWRLVNGRWSRSFGERGTRVRCFQLEVGGTFYRDVYLSSEKGYSRKSMGTKDKREAELLAKQLLAELLRSGTEGSISRPLTLDYLWQRYSRECSMYLDNTA